jgi:hypothetical protein
MEMKPYHYSGTLRIAEEADAVQVAKLSDLVLGLN